MAIRKRSRKTGQVETVKAKRDELHYTSPFTGKVTVHERVLDFELENEGSIVLLRPLTQQAEQWLDDNIGDDRQSFGKAVVIEPRYVENIVDGIQADGLTL